MTAPSRSAVLFENIAHLPMLDEPGRTLRVLVDRVRLLAGADLPDGC